jgi:hypothetical protein
MEDKSMMVFVDGCWKEVERTEEDKQRTYFRDFKFYYANIIDYTRIAMCLIASVTVVSGWPLTSAILLMTQTLLDW